MFRRSFVEITGGSPDLVLDTAPVSGVLPDLIKIAGGDPRRVLTITDFGAASQLGARSSLGEDATSRYDVLGKFRPACGDRPVHGAGGSHVQP